MKVGEKVFSTKVRPWDVATITKMDLQQHYNEKKNRMETRTTYTAEFDDGTSLIFYGFNINKSIFKHVVPDGQMDLSQFMPMPEDGRCVNPICPSSVNGMCEWTANTNTCTSRIY